MLDIILDLVKLIFAFGLLGFIVGAVFYTLSFDRPLLDHAISHWNQTIPELKCTPSEFYQRIEELIRDQKMPDVKARTVDFYEGSFLSDKRVYLRVEREGYIFDLCVARFGESLFISSWLCRDPRAFFRFLANLPFFGWFFKLGRLIFDPETYYTVDSGLMFQGAVHSSVLHVLDEMTTAQGLDPISETDRKPVMGEIYGRRKKAG